MRSSATDEGHDFAAGPRAAVTRCLVAAAAVVTLAMPIGAHAATKSCASDDETRGFVLRHLQSRLMVAALSCNQRDAYNAFMQRFLPQLGTGGKSLIAYYQRTGGGQQALNKHVTDLANAAGLTRAADPAGYCAATWRVFWELERAPEKLEDFARQNLVTTMALPRNCADPVPDAKPKVTKASVPAAAKPQAAAKTAPAGASASAASAPAASPPSKAPAQEAKAPEAKTTSKPAK